MQFSESHIFCSAFSAIASEMALSLYRATAEEADRIAEIHLAAFDSNPLLHMQFPTSSSLDALKDVLARDMRHSIEAGEECGKVVLVVKDGSANDMIISFAKWEFPTVNKDVSVTVNVMFMGKPGKIHVAF